MSDPHLADRTERWTADCSLNRGRGKELMIQLKS